MKIFVITDLHGRVTGTVRQPPPGEHGLTVRVGPSKHQRVHEVELPQELQRELGKDDDIGAFHRAVEKLVPQSRKTKRNGSGGRARKSRR